MGAFYVVELHRVKNKYREEQLLGLGRAARG